MPVSTAPRQLAPPTAGVRYWHPSKLAKWRNARSAVLDGSASADARVLFTGDSTFNGVVWINTWANTIPVKLSTKLAARGLPMNPNVFCSGYTFDGTAGCPLAALPSGWAVNSPLAWDEAVRNNSNTNAISLTPNINVDTFDIWYITVPTSGILAWAIDGGSATNIDTAAALGLVKATVPAGSVGSHTLTVNRVSGGYIYIAAIVGYDSTAKKIQCWNSGISGKAVADFADATNPYSHLNAITALAPHLTFINLTINDSSAGTNVATYRTNLQSIVTAAKASGDVVMCIGNPVESFYTGSAQVTYQNIALDIARLNNLVVCDIFQRWGQASTARSGWYADSPRLHPNFTGADDIADMFATLMAA